jgi:hypothetical protein
MTNIELEQQHICHREVMHKVNPCKFAKVIYETGIILVTTNGNGSRSHTSEKINCSGFWWSDV